MKLWISLVLNVNASISIKHAVKLILEYSNFFQSSGEITSSVLPVDFNQLLIEKFVRKDLKIVIKCLFILGYFKTNFFLLRLQQANA